MKTLGLIGGMSWESTVPYYQTINRFVGARLGGLHSARLVLYSVEFHEIEVLQHEGRWEEAGEILADAARAVHRAGAEAIVLCTNTMHKVAGQIEAAVDIPLLHIADATASRVKQAGVSRVGLLGTKFTMEQDFYRGRLEARHGLDGADAAAGTARPGAHGDLRRTVPRPGGGGVAAGVPADRVRPGGAGRTGRHPRLHGDWDAAATRRRRGAALRHGRNPRRSRSRVGAGGGGLRLRTPARGSEDPRYFAGGLASEMSLMPPTRFAISILACKSENP